MAKSLFALLAHRFEPQSCIDRREFLKTTLAAGAGLLISGPFAVRGHEPENSRDSRRILIIGAGFAGLACAHELLHAGCKVTVLEARNRVAGRVMTLRNFVKGKEIEGGAEFIGSNHPAWLTYAKKFGLKLYEVTEEADDNSAFFFDGHWLDVQQAKALFEEMKTVTQQMTADARDINEDEPWLSANAAKLDRMDTGTWLSSLNVSALCKKAFDLQMQANNGVALGQQSYLGNLTQVKGGGLEKYWTESEVYRCRGGNERLAQKFAEILGRRLRLNTPVRSVKLTDSRAIVKTLSGETIEADDVVLAVPPSVWSRIRFEPDLPETLEQQMGMAVKYVTRVRSKFWEANRLKPDASSDTMVSMTWDPTEGQTGPGDALSAFSGGPAASKCRSDFALEGKKAYNRVLEQLFPGYVTNATASIFMNWPSIHWTMAGYCFPSPGQITRVGPILRKGIGKLHFAGEHTCFKFVGYMEGALNSGVSLATRLAGSHAIASWERAEIGAAE
jgi:Monoamine oxidase